MVKVAEADVIPRNEQVDDKVDLQSEASRGDIFGLLGSLPTRFPSLHIAPETLEEKNKRLLVALDDWLHSPAEPFEMIGLDGGSQKFFHDDELAFARKVESTKDIMCFSDFFWEKKKVLEKAFPNYEFVTDLRGEDNGTYYNRLIRKPGLVDCNGKTRVGYSPGLVLEGWEIAELGGMTMLKSASGELLLPDDDDDLVKQLDRAVKTSIMKQKWASDSVDGVDVPIEAYLKAVE